MPANSQPLNLDRLPPNDAAAEAGVLGCCLLEPALTDRLNWLPGAFYDLRHAEIWTTLKKMRAKNLPIDLITVQQRLKSKKKLEQVGGVAYISRLQDAVPSAANLDYYAEIVREKWEMRRIITGCTDVVAKIYDYEGHLDDLKFAVQTDLADIFGDARQPGGDSLDWDDLLEFNTANDANNVIGFHDGRTTRYLCRGHSAWLIGPSGVGKSSLLFQFGISWACGLPIFGIAPQHPLRVLVVQAENDTGDMSEMAKGIRDGLDVEFSTLLKTNILVRSVDGLIGQSFCAWLRREIEAYRADMVLVDPLLSFAGIDVSRQDQVSQFCRVWLGPVLRETGAVLISAHHTGKPQRQDAKARPQTLTDMAYAGIGSSELVNWSRAVMLLERVDANAFRLQLAKRGRRARATHPSGEPTECIWLRHATNGSIFWEQTDPPVEPEKEEKSTSSGGRKSIVNQVLSLGCGAVIDSLKNPVGKNELAKLIEDHCSAHHLDVSESTCKRVVEELVKNNAIQKKDGKYVKS